MSNEINEALTKLNQLILGYEKIKAESYIYDYIDEIINKVDIHREELLKEIHQISYEIIRQLNEKEKQCKINASKLKKKNIEQIIKPADLQSFKHLLRKPDINEADLKDLLTNINERIKDVQIETKKFKFCLLMNEGIYFEKHEKSSSFGKISCYLNELNVLSEHFGQLISFKQNQSRITSIQVDENLKKLITASKDGTITISNLQSGG